MSKTQEAGEMAEALARIEERQAVFEQVAHRMIGMMEVHNEKLDAILEAATREPGPSPIAETLAAILVAIQEQTKLLSGLPQILDEAVREEMQRDLETEGYETEPAVPGAFDDRDSGPH